MFIPLQKADAAQRLVYGSFDETPDRANEVCDYATAKPAFEAWSAELSKNSDGKSLGNIRGQHSNIAAGKLVEITFDDLGKSIGFVAKIVDDNEWRKVEEGVYTGFSPGGKYAKRWADGSHTRYTPIVRELSVVDVPCNPNAVFTMVKADGAEEEISFTLAKAYEPGNDATKTRAEDMAKAAAGTSFKDHVVQARADLIAENAAAELAKMSAEPDAEPAAEPAAAEPDVVDTLTATLAKANDVVAAAVVPAASAAATDGPFADLSKAAAALRLIAAPEGVELAKSLYTISRLADLLDCFQGIVAETIYEANSEGDGSAQPAKAAEAMKAMGELLCMMTQEEVAEAMAELPDLTPSVIIVDGEVQVMALAEQIVDLVKADTDLMEKAAGRTSWLLKAMAATSDSGDADIDFATNMIAHHKMALPMAAKEIKNGSDAAMIKLAKSIKSGQTAEISEMQTWLDNNEDVEKFAKAGKRNSKADATKIQTMHDHAVSLGATCDMSAEKAEALTLENDRLTKAVSNTVPQVEKLIATVERLAAEATTNAAEMNKMQGELAKFAAAPAPAKGSVMVVVSKEGDADLTKTVETEDPDEGLTLNQRAQREANRLRSRR